MTPGRMKIKTIIWLAVFSMAMGYLESAVVVYLRKLYYPDGFKFPLVPMEAEMAMVELLREAATILMLLGIGMLSARKASLRFAAFIFCFAIWDLFYYLFLWILLDWPESFFTWDILFLIPVPWVGPVIAPCILCLNMILLASAILYYHAQEKDTRLKANEWGLFAAGSFVVILSFVWDFWKYLRAISFTDRSDALSGSQYLDGVLSDYIPSTFNWPLFLAGLLVLAYGTLVLIRRFKSENPVSANL